MCGGKLPAFVIVNPDIDHLTDLAVAVCKYKRNLVAFLYLANLFIKQSEKNRALCVPGAQAKRDVREVLYKVNHDIVALFLHFPGDQAKKCGRMGICQRIGVGKISQYYCNNLRGSGGKASGRGIWNISHFICQSLDACGCLFRYFSLMPVHNP